MNILQKVTWQAMWKNRTRTIVTIIGVILSAAMFCAVTTLVASLRDFLVRGEIYASGDYYVNFAFADESDKSALLADSRVSSIADLQTHGYFKAQSPAEYGDEVWSTFLVGSADANFYSSMPIRVKEGRLPENSNELIVSERVFEVLEDLGTPISVGDTLRFQIETGTSLYEMELPESEFKAYEVTYTVVGKMEDFRNLPRLYLDTMLTLADGSEPETIWHNLYTKTEVPADAWEMAEEKIGEIQDVHSSLLLYFASSQYNNYNVLFGGITVVLIGIIMTGAISMIHNAFSISVSERTKQFGLLTSVGATKKQLRHAVMYEAVILCAIGIPIGLICGWGGIAVVLKLLSPTIQSMFAMGDVIFMYAVISPAAVIGAAVISILTVLISAAAPAGKATKVSPIAAIRQTNDYTVRNRDIKVGRLTQRVFGLPGVLAKKYYNVSRKKYRATIISLAISVVLFLSASSLSQEIRLSAERSLSTNHFDFVIWSIDRENIDLDEMDALNQIRQMDGVTESVLQGNDNGYLTVLPRQQIHPDYAVFTEEHMESAANEDYLSTNVGIAYIEDSKLEEYLQKHGIDPAPYLDADDPTALVLQLTQTFYEINGDDSTRYTKSLYPVTENVTELTLYDRFDWWSDPKYENWLSIDILTDDGRYYVHLLDQDLLYGDPDVTDEEREAMKASKEIGDFYIPEFDEAGMLCYYPYDPIQDTHDAEAYVTLQPNRTSVKLGARVGDFDISSQGTMFYNIVLVLPISALPEDGGLSLSLQVETSSAESFRAYFEENDIRYNDYLVSEQQNRGLLLIIDVFSYGFIILISLICVANVFNTISTNIALRRRDFGMLRSVGMKTGELYRMMNFECLIYGAKSLLWGMPLGLLIGYGIHAIFVNTVSTEYLFPWHSVAVAAVCVFLVVFSSMFYAVSKLKRDNPIDAIRMENT